MSGFTKLKSSIIQSTIWDEAHHIRILWITILALSDSRGVVESSIPGLAKAARLTIDECLDGIKKLESPDRWSRTKEYEGRRIRPIEGGWLVLNYLKHRGRTSADRMRDKRERDRGDRDLEIEKQGFCGCCSEPFEKPYHRFVCWDHSHETGEFRSFLCQSCNKIIGLIEESLPCVSEKRKAAEEYINRYQKNMTECDVTLSHTKSQGSPSGSASVSVSGSSVLNTYIGRKEEEKDSSLSRKDVFTPDDEQKYLFEVEDKTDNTVVEKKRTSKSKSKSINSTVTKIAERYLEIFNAVFDRRCRNVTPTAIKVYSRLEEGVFSAWQILCTPILQRAADPSVDKLNNFAPEMLLRDGKHGRTGVDGRTYGAVDWMDRIYGRADTLRLDSRLTAIAKHYELLDDIKRTGCGVIEDENAIENMA